MYFSHIKRLWFCWVILYFYRKATWKCSFMCSEWCAQKATTKKSSTFTVSYTTARKPWLKRKTFFSNANKWRQKCIHFIETLRHWVRVWLFWYVLANTCRDGNASLTLDAREFWFAEIFIVLFLFDWLNSWRLSFPPLIQKWSFPSLPFFFLLSSLFVNRESTGSSPFCARFWWSRKKGDHRRPRRNTKSGGQPGCAFVRLTWFLRQQQ